MPIYDRRIFTLSVALHVTALLLVLAFGTTDLHAQTRRKFFPGPVRDTLRVVVIGSSTAAGSGAWPYDNGWVPRYRKYLSRFQGPSRVDNLAMGGYTSYHLQPDWFQPPNGEFLPDSTRKFLPDSARNISAALRLKPHAIIMNVPTNDMAERISLQKQIENYERIALHCDSANVPLWVTTTQPRNFSTHQQQGLQIMRKWILARFREYAVDFWEGVATSDGGILPLYDVGDGIHINNAGHALFLERIVLKDIPSVVRATTASATASPAPVVFSAYVYPNPFNGTTTINVQLAKAAATSVTISDVLGETRSILYQGFLQRGRHAFPAAMERFPPGMYIYSIASGTEAYRGKMIKLP